MRVYITIESRVRSALKAREFHHAWTLVSLSLVISVSLGVGLNRRKRHPRPVGISRAKLSPFVVVEVHSNSRNISCVSGKRHHRMCISQSVWLSTTFTDITIYARISHPTNDIVIDISSSSASYRYYISSSKKNNSAHTVVAAGIKITEHKSLQSDCLRVVHTTPGQTVR